MADNFDLMATALKAVCPNNEILLDNAGKPSVMVRIPKMTYSMHSAKRCCEMRPGTITEIRNVCLTVKSHSAFFRWKNWGSSRV